MKKFSEIFQLDPRSLSLFRILLGLFLIGDLLARILDLTEFYSDAGVLPRYALSDSFPHSWALSPLNLFGEPSWVFAYMLLALVSYLALLVGYRTRWATFFSWVFFSSFSARNPIVAHGGDDLVRLCLFWSMFLNLDAHWSLKKNQNPANAPLASLAFVSQLLLMYFSSALLKWHPVWHTDGTAIYYALNLDSFATPVGQWLRQRPPDFLKALTLGTFWLELLGPWVWLLALRWPRLRQSLSFVFIIFHLGLMVSLELGPFPFACAIYWIALLPGEFWNYLSKNRPALALSPNLLEFSTQSNGPNKHEMISKLRQAFVLFCWFLCLAWNIAVYSNQDSIQLAPWTYKVGTLLRLHQRWDMFAPFPKTADAWLVVDATLRNGTHYDILNDRPVDFSKPSNLADEMVDTLWRKYLSNLSNHGFRKYLPYFSQWTCRQWNTNRDSATKAVRLTLWFASEKTPPPGQPSEVSASLSIWNHLCFAGEDTR